jgi:two-component system NtrC family sensor kinase
MTNRANNHAKQLKEACKVTGARWALWVEHGSSGWNAGVQYGLSQARQKVLGQFASHSAVTAWLAGALSSGRTRSRAAGSLARSLGCQRIYVFPNIETRCLLLVGAGGLVPASEGLFRTMAYCPPQEPSDTVSSIAEPPIWPFEAGLEASYDPQHALETILEFLASKLPCESAYLAIRYGDSFHLQAAWKCPSEMQGFDVTLQEDGPLGRILSTRQGMILDEIDQEPNFVLKAALNGYHSWMGVPIQVGQRTIGMAAFASLQPGTFKASHVQQAALNASRLAYSIESAIIFSELARYLQQLALLNELASTASLGLDTDKESPKDEFARRVMLRLRRTFKTDWAAVLLLSSDGERLLEYGGGSRGASPWSVPVASSLMGQAVKAGLPVRVGDLQRATHVYTIDPEYRSELAVPLKYRGRVIGALVLVSKEPNAFSIQDEQLLVVIASQMAGLFENMRLNEETRERAQKLTDSVRQLQAVRDTSLDIAGDLDVARLLTRLAHRARDLVDARGAEIGLYIEAEQVVEIVVSETPWENVQGIKIPLMAGVAGRMAVFGEPIVVSDYNHWSGRLLPERRAAFQAVAGVPLKFKGQVIGTLTVLDDRPDKFFQSEDVQLLELLAPQAAISIRNARLYQELQERIKAEELAESRLIRSARLAAVGEMAAGVAHELNNPLTTVTGFVELALEELPADASQRSELELVLEEANRARGVVRRLLDFSRPVENQRVRADVNELVEQVLPLVNHLARTGGVTIQTQLQPDLPWISLDPNQIKQVLLNLIHNGLQAMSGETRPARSDSRPIHSAGGTLTITTSQEEREWSGRIFGGDQLPQWVTIAVEDTGEGIPPENLERIFEPFFSTRPAGKGTGLGLSVSYGIISSHEGFIEVDSQAGRGSRFTVYLPIQTAEREEDEDLQDL